MGFTPTAKKHVMLLAVVCRSLTCAVFDPRDSSWLRSRSVALNSSCNFFTFLYSICTCEDQNWKVQLLTRQPPTTATSRATTEDLQWSSQRQSSASRYAITIAKQHGTPLFRRLDN